jgi:formamidopyrimidine-DNA glycosylase
MIELPEAVVITRQVTDTLCGKRIARAVANASPHKFAWYTGDPENYHKLLIGKTIQGAVAYGNHMEVLAGDRLLVISTPIRYHTPGAKLPEKHQLLLEFTDRSAVTCNVQMWGVLFCLGSPEESSLPDYPIARQKPSPLSEAFDRAYFTGLYEHSLGSISAKEFLATKQRIPGLGNGVLQDILWTARIHPRRKMADLADGEKDAMFLAVKLVVASMVARGGRDTEVDLFWQPGGYRTVLSKNTGSTPCPACGASIRKEPFLGGAIYFCPGCQEV